MRDETRLALFVEGLLAQPASEAPVNEAWKEMLARLRGGGTQVVDRGTYAYFLEVLPPHYHGGDFFAFCEGREALKLFARVRGKCVCRQLTWDQTATFCALAGIDLPD
jgi:hypothetical protein